MKIFGVIGSICMILVFLMGIFWFQGTIFSSFFPSREPVGLFAPSTIAISPTSIPTISTTLPTVASTVPRPFSLDDLFTYQDPTNIASAAADEVVLIATGDVIPARSVNAAMVKKNNFTFPFEKTISLLKSGDILFINLETPLFEGCASTIVGMRFCGDARAIEGLTYAGVTVTSIGNNHAGNYGLDGIQKTIDLLEKNNISVTGSDPVKPIVVERKGKRFGFLGYNDIGHKEAGIAWANIPTVTQDIKELKKTADHVVVTFHWGIEYESTPSARQKELGRAAVDAGADLVIGNHPHWVQGVELYKETLITYAHGNFVFDQMWSQETREGVVGRYVFGPEGLRRVSYYPIIIDSYSTPRFASEKESARVLGRMKDSTKIIGTMKH